MAKQVINIGSAERAGDGESLRSAFEKINGNFTELYDTNITSSQITKDIKGSVFADDSSVIIDGVSGKITTSALTQAGAQNGQVLAWSSTNNEWQPSNINVAGAITGDLTGSVFADDSTLLVDGVNGEIPAANLTGTITLPVTANVTGDLTGDVTGNVTGDVTGNITGDVTGDVTGNITGNVTGNLDGDINGSVFADDSTLLVDGVNGKVIAANLEGSLPAIPADSVTVNGTAIQTTINTISAALAIGLS